MGRIGKGASPGTDAAGSVIRGGMFPARENAFPSRLAKINLATAFGVGVTSVRLQAGNPAISGEDIRAGPSHGLILLLRLRSLGQLTRGGAFPDPVEAPRSVKHSGVTL